MSRAGCDTLPGFLYLCIVKVIHVCIVRCKSGPMRIAPDFSFSHFKADFRRMKRKDDKLYQK